MDGRRPWTPLLGVLFVLLLTLRLFAIGRGAPGAEASGEEVLAYYTEHEVREVVASLTAVAAAAFLVFFAAHVRAVIRREGADDYLATVAFGGALLLAAALGTAEGLHGALAVDPEYLTPEAAKALNVLDSQFVFPTMLGFGTFLAAVGLASVRRGLLPAPLGWSALALAAAAFTPAALFAFALALLWIAIAAVVLYLRGRAVELAAPS